MKKILFLCLAFSLAQAVPTNKRQLDAAKKIVQRSIHQVRQAEARKKEHEVRAKIEELRLIVEDELSDPEKWVYSTNPQEAKKIRVRKWESDNSSDLERLNMGIDSVYDHGVTVFYDNKVHSNGDESYRLTGIDF